MTLDELETQDVPHGTSESDTQEQEVTANSEMEIIECDKEERKELPAEIGRVTQKTAFTDMLDAGNIAIVKQASENDEKFVDDLKKQLKEAALKNAEVENEKQELEKQNVQYAQELLDTQQKLNQHTQEENKWDNRRKARQYHYDGVKDVMLCIGIKNPMCILLLYFLFVFALPIFILKVVVQGTFGNLVMGAIDADRPKAMKGFLWTLLVFSVLCVIALGLYLVFRYVILI